MKKNTSNKNNKTVTASKNTVNNTQATQKNGRGRPKGSLGFGLVSLKDLVAVLPESANLPISNSVLRGLAKVGVDIQSTPFRAGGGAINEITKKFQKTTAQVVNLNEETETVI